MYTIPQYQHDSMSIWSRLIPVQNSTLCSFVHFGLTLNLTGLHMKMGSLEKEVNYYKDKHESDQRRVMELENKNREASAQIAEQHMQVGIALHTYQ